MEHSQIILNYFKEKGVTKYRVAKDTGISESLFSKWEAHPTSEISSRVLIELSNYLECPIDFLLKEPNNNEVQTMNNKTFISDKILKSMYARGLYETISKLCTNKNISINNIISKCSLTKDKIDLLANGKLSLTSNDIYNICECFNIKISEFLKLVTDNINTPTKTPDNNLDYEQIKISYKILRDMFLCEKISSAIQNQISVTSADGTTHYIDADVLIKLINGTYNFSDISIKWFLNLFNLKSINDLLNNSSINKNIFSSSEDDNFIDQRTSRIVAETKESSIDAVSGIDAKKHLDE